MSEGRLTPKSIAVIGAGVSGVAAAIHLRRVGLDVTVFERNAQAGGIWVYEDAVAHDAAYPSILPSVGDSPEFEQRWINGKRRADSPIRTVQLDQTQEKLDIAASFAPPGPCYVALKNNVSTIEMRMSVQAWKPGTEEFVSHNVLAEYIQNAAQQNQVSDIIQFNTRLCKLEKAGTQWKLELARRESVYGEDVVQTAVENFDAVVIATGHYNAPKIPDFPGLADWKRKHPSRLYHSKRYRNPSSFKGQNVLLIGAGVSSLDMAKDLGTVATNVFQSSRGGMYDLPSHYLPQNAARVGAIRGFESLSTSELNSDGSIPGSISFASGDTLCNIYQVILCTGYHVSFPFMRQFHADGLRPEEANEQVLVTDGQVTHNLHKDIWYIEDPTMAFVGVPYHTATFTLFEFQAMALAAVFSGTAALPSREKMRQEYQDRVRRKGAGRQLHSLKGYLEEPAYVNELAEMVNSTEASSDRSRMVGHSSTWLEAYERRRKRHEVIFGKVRDPCFDQAVRSAMPAC